MSRQAKYKIWCKSGGGEWLNPSRIRSNSDGQLYCDGVMERAIVLVQYTGLKDMNGKDIYEGDIIRLVYGIPSTSDRLVVEYSDNEVIEDISVSGWWMRNIVKHRLSGSLCKAYEGDIEIIGNIYENPELSK